MHINVEYFSKEVPEPFRSKLSGSYMQVFSLPPWNESFTGEEVVKIITNWERVGADIFLITIKENVVGFGIGMTLSDYHDQALILPHIPIPPSKVYWLTDVGVDTDFQGLGLGKLLTNLRLTTAKERGMEAVAARTRPDSKAYSLLISLGFDEVGQDSFITGGVESTRAIFLKKLS